jgi:hypothetical protein
MQGVIQGSVTEQKNTDQAEEAPVERHEGTEPKRQSPDRGDIR